MKKILLSVAGYDPSSGAGVALDLKVFQLLGFQGVAVVTAITSQNTMQVKHVNCLGAELVLDQYRTLREDISISGIKVGMVGCRENIRVIKEILSDNPKIPKVIDSVFRSSSGFWLLEKKSIPAYISEIKGKASLITPNIQEARLISGITIKNKEDMKKAAQTITSLSQIPCLLKGGCFEDEMVDLLYDGEKFHFFKKEILKKRTHGTGCFLSSSLLAYLVRGYSLKKATFRATGLTHTAIKKSIPIGKGQRIISFPLHED